MKCRQARADLALWAGGDLTDAEAHALVRHCAACPDCRALRDGLRVGQSALQAAALEAVAVAPPGAARNNGGGAARNGGGGAARGGCEGDSLWPAVATRLAQSDAARARRFNGWIPALAVTAACVAVIFVAGQNAARYAGTTMAPQPLFQPTPAAAPAAGQPAAGQPFDGFSQPFGPSLDDNERLDAPRRDAFPPWWNAPRDATPRDAAPQALRGRQ